MKKVIYNAQTKKTQVVEYELSQEEIQKQLDDENKRKNQEEYDSLINWLDNVYDKKVMKLERLIRQNKFYDGLNPSDVLYNLDIEAEQKRVRIQELEKILKNN